MKYLEITEVSIASGMEYAPASYPGAGIYLNKANGQIYCVYLPSAGSVPCVTNIGLPTTLPVREMAALDPEPDRPKAAPTGHVGEDFVLRALAIAQNPNLATQLLGQRLP